MDYVTLGLYIMVISLVGYYIGLLLLPVSNTPI